MTADPATPPVITARLEHVRRTFNGELVVEARWGDGAAAVCLRQGHLIDTIGATGGRTLQLSRIRRDLIAAARAPNADGRRLLTLAQADALAAADWSPVETHLRAIARARLSPEDRFAEALADAMRAATSRRAVH